MIVGEEAVPGGDPANMELGTAEMETTGTGRLRTSSGPSRILARGERRSADGGVVEEENDDERKGQRRLRLHRLTTRG